MLALAALLAACRPETRGRCAADADCKDGAFCGATGVCLSTSGVCAPECTDGELCVSGQCAALRPQLTVTPPPGFLSPQQPNLTVHLEAAATLSITALTVEVRSGSDVLASGVLAKPTPGDNTVALAHFAPGAVGTATAVATVTFSPDPASSQQVSSPPVAALVDAAPPVLAIFYPAASDTVSGWVPRSPGGKLEVRVQLDDGQGSGPAGATLKLDACPAVFPCSYDGKKEDAKTWSFQVPREVQLVGGETPVSFSVTGLDKAGNAAVATGALQIDDAPPVIGSLTAITAGTVGEDGRVWYLGGSGAPSVRVALPVSDRSGLKTLSATIENGDVNGGTSSTLVPSPQSDGTVQLDLPAGGVRGREGKLRFIATATDAFGHSTTTASGALFILVDDVQPQVSLAHLDYSSAQPSGVCAQADSATFQCGRTSTQLLRDDQASITVDAYDCGVGLASGVPTVTVGSGGKTAVIDKPSESKNGTPCGTASTNPTHHATLAFNGGTHAPSLDAPVNNVSTATLTSNVSDRLGHTAHATPGAGPDGLVQLSRVRWRAKLPGTPTGAPALIPGSGARTVVVGSDSAVTALGADGALQWTAAVASHVAADVAVGPDGFIRAVSGDRACPSGVEAHCGTLAIVEPTSGDPAVLTCFARGAGFGAPPAMVGNAAVVAATGRDLTGKNLGVYTASSNLCAAADEQTLAAVGDLTGATAFAGQIVVSHASGFSSIPISQDGKLTVGSAASFSPATASLAPPALATGNTPYALFFGTDDKLRRSLQTTCTGFPCWKNDDAAFTLGTSAAGVGATPVFDNTFVYATDSQGALHAWPFATGGTGTTVAATSAQPASAPALLEGNNALVVQKDGVVRVVTPSSSSAATVAQVGAFGTVPVTPVLDTRPVGSNSGSVAYVPDGQGWMWAIHLNGAPLQASSTAWPRPGRDTCNSRYAGSSCN